MLISLFAVNASAMISSTYTEIVGATDEIVMIEQDFSDPEKTDFTSSAGYYSKATVEADGTVTVHTPSTVSLNVSSWTPVTAEKWTVEFDVRRNSDLTNTEYYGLTFICIKDAYANDSDKTSRNINKYGIYLPLQDKDKDVWYTYRITFDETKATTDKWSSKMVVVPSAQYKKAGDAEWTTIRSNWADAGWNVTGNQSKILLGTDVSGYGELNFSFSSRTGTADAEEIANANFSLDNIKVYVPATSGEEVVKNYPLYNGTIHLAKEAPAVPAPQENTNTQTQHNYTTVMTAPADGTTKSYTLSFDAKNTVQGMPLLFHIGGANQAREFAICSTDTIGNDWYSYRVPFTESAVAGGNLSVVGVYRKPLGSDEPWEKLSGDDFCFIITQSNQYNAIRLYYHKLTSSYIYPNSTWEDTVWEVANLQVTDEAALAGFANLVDGTITVDAEIIAASGDAGVALAVYDNDDRLYDVDFKRYIGGAGDLDMTVNYVEGYDANLLVWDFAGNALDPLVSVIDIAAIAE